MIIKLGQAMNKREMSQAQFAKELGISSKVFARVFKPNANPKLRDIMIWAKLLKVKVKDLLVEDGKPEIVITRPATAIKSIKAIAANLNNTNTKRRRKMPIN